MFSSPAFEQGSYSSHGVNIHYEHAGTGEPLLLVHGYPQTHLMWHRVAPALAEKFHVICPDLRGYGDSDKPADQPGHYAYSKRAMAADLTGLMSDLGYERFAVAGHDRGARVTHRLCLDAADRVTRACVMDIVPTHYMFGNTDRLFATSYYHWFFLIQPGGLPEKLIGADPDYYLREKLQRWSAEGAEFDEQAVQEYVRCFSDPLTIHATCEDYRAAASIDLQHDAMDRECRVECPLLVLWGSEGFVNRRYDVLDVWSDYASNVSGQAIDGCGHFVPEEAPEATLSAMFEFFSG